MYKKTFGFIAAVVIIAMTVVAAYLIRNPSQKEVANTRNPTAETSIHTTRQQDKILKTYTNTKYEYTINYDSEVYTINAFNPEPKEDPAADTVLFFKTALLDSPEPLASLMIHASPNPKKLQSPRDYFTQEIDDTGHTSIQNTTLNGMPALAYGSERDQYILITKDRFALTLSAGDLELLNTFRFINTAMSQKIYTDAKTGIAFTYPTKLTLTKEKDAVILSHSVTYQHNGCDMSGGTETYNTLTDFKIKFQVSTDPQALPYIDGQYAAGALKGTWAYEGAEGCGYSAYHFPLGGNKTLIVTRESVQQLSGVVTSDIRDEILRIPGAMSQEESEALFRTVLTSLTYK